MKDLMGIIVAIAGAVGAVASCSEKNNPGHPDVSRPPASTDSAASAIYPLPPTASGSSQSSSGPIPPDTKGSTMEPTGNISTSDIVAIVLSYSRELNKLNNSYFSGDNGVAAESRLQDAREKVRLSSFIAKNMDLLEGLAARNPDISAAIDEGKKHGFYKNELAKLVNKP